MHLKEIKNRMVYTLVFFGTTIELAYGDNISVEKTNGDIISAASFLSANEYGITYYDSNGDITGTPYFNVVEISKMN